MAFPGVIYAQGPPVVLSPQNTPGTAMRNLHLVVSGGPVVWPEKARGVRGALYGDYKKYNGDLEASFYKHSPAGSNKETVVYERVAAGIRIKKVFMRATFMNVANWTDSSRKTAYGVGIGAELRFSIKDRASVEFETSGFPHVFTNIGPGGGMLSRSNYKARLVGTLFVEVGMDTFIVVPDDRTNGRFFMNNINAHVGLTYRMQ